MPIKPERTLEDIRKALVNISPWKTPTASGLGTICGDFILTCSHINNEAIPLYPFHTPFFEVRRIHDGVTGNLSFYLATSMDFMALGADGIHSLSSDGGPTDTAFDVLTNEDGQPNTIRPALLDFSNRADGAVKIQGFFFSPDGQQMNQAEFNVTSDSPMITYSSNDTKNGCSGGPIFTEDLHLIGFVTNSRATEPGEAHKHCIGKRIDLCCPLLLQRKLTWDTLIV